MSDDKKKDTDEFSVDTSVEGGHTQMGFGAKLVSPASLDSMGLADIIKPLDADPDTPVAALADEDTLDPSKPEEAKEFADTVDSDDSVDSAPPNSTLIAASPPPAELLAAIAAADAGDKVEKQQAPAKTMMGISSDVVAKAIAAKPAKPEQKMARTMLGTASDAAPAEPAKAEPAKAEQANRGTLPQGGQPNVAPDESFADKRVGHDLGGYHVIRKLAEGGMGVVYEAEHKKIGRKGAIKVLKAEFCQDPKVVERFYLEARAVNEIGHENIVDIFDFGKTPEGGVFFVMDFLEGLALSDRLRKSAVPWSESLSILRQTIQALKAAHAKGFVHRDLKPDNIFLEIKDGAMRVKLLDFGIAKLVGMEGAEDKLTQTGSMIGTPHYMSPEQINGSAEIDHRTDIYSLGIIMYEMFSGATPFQGNTLGEIITGHLLEEAPLLTDLPEDLGVPQPIADIIHRMLAKKPEERYDKVEDVLSDLADIDKDRAPETAIALQTSRPMTAAAVARQTVVVPPPAASSSKAWLPIAGIGGAVIIAGAIFFTRGGGDTTTTAPVAGTDTTTTAVVDAPPEKPGLDYDAIRLDAQKLIRTALEESAPGIRVRGSDAAGDTIDPGSAVVLFKLAQEDPSQEVRGHAASALGKIGHVDALKAFRSLEKKAAGPLQPWYAQALHALGDEKARKRLVKYAKSKDLAVAFKSALILGDISKPGDKDAIAALTKLASREAELNEFVPYAGAFLLSKLAALRSPGARGILYSILEQEDENAQLAAAEGLARLGDDGGAEILATLVTKTESSSQLRAAVTLVLLGDYSGYDVLAENLESEDAGARTKAAQGLGYLGETRSVEALLPLLSDKDWNVRIATAVALVAIVGLDPALLAQASVDWTRSALESEDWNKREEAADVLGELPEKQAVPLLAQAIADSSPKVRLAAARSARKLRSAEAAQHVAAAALTEKDPLAQEEQVKALGAIGQAGSAETLRTLTSNKGRVGVFAAGSLIAVGDTSGKDRLIEAVSDKRTTIRLAAVEAAANAKNDTVVPVLTTGVADKDFDVRFSASEGLAQYGAEKALAVPVLESGLLSDSVSIKARAHVGLLRFGEADSNAVSAEELLDSSDPENRLAAIALLKIQEWKEARPKVMRLVNDTDLRVRRASVDLLDEFVAKDTEGVKTIYKSLTKDNDLVTRSKAQARLALLVDPLPKPKAPIKTPTVTPDVPAEIDAGAAATPEQVAEFDAGMESLRKTLEEVQGALTEQKAADSDFQDLVAVPAKNDRARSKASKAAKELTKTATAMEATAESARETLDAIMALVEETGAPDLVSRASEAEGLYNDIVDVVAEATEFGAAAKTASDVYTAATVEPDPNLPDPAVSLAGANEAFEAEKFALARKLTRETRKLYKAQGAEPDPLLLFLDGMLSRQAADAIIDKEKRLRLLQKSHKSFKAYVRNGTGENEEKAKEELSEIKPIIDDLKRALETLKQEAEASDAPAPAE